MELKQQLRLTQQLVMTPQLQQAIRLLQLSRLELIDEVRKELDGNPILSAEEDPDPKGRASDDASRAAGAAAGSGVVERGERVENNYSEPTKTMPLFLKMSLQQTMKLSNIIF